ncbi:MAG: hypothetical protein ACHQ03_11765 [Candidatus Bathyarchaeia archaeon]
MARKKIHHHYSSRRLQPTHKADLSPFVPKEEFSETSGLRALDNEPRRIKNEEAEDHRFDPGLGRFLEDQGRVDDPPIIFEFEEDAQKLSDFLRQEEHLDFVPEFDTTTDIFTMTMLRIKPLENGRAAFSFNGNNELTEQQLKAISPDAYQLYVQVKDKRHKQQSTVPKENYYQIDFKVPGAAHESIFGRLAPGRGRILNKDEAIREFKQVVSYSLQKFRNEPHKGFEENSLVYVPDQKSQRVVELKIATPEEAEKFLIAH